jgi:hypothetical protein
MDDVTDMVDMVHHFLYTHVHTIVVTFNYNWYDKNKLDYKVCDYRDCLLVIGPLAQGKEQELKSSSEKNITYISRKKSFH